MAIPKVFVSYSHDSKEHKLWVLNLAIRLRQEGGVDAILDQWELQPGDDIPNFMEKHLDNSDYVIMICTARYVEKANAGEGGVGYEKMIVTSELLKNIKSNKVIPIIKQDSTRLLPTFLKTKLFIDFSITENFEIKFDELIRTIQNAPIYKKPNIGSNPFKANKISEAQKNIDPLNEILGIIAQQYELGFDWISYGDIRDRSNISRIMLDLILKEASEKGYITVDAEKDISLLDGGKSYVVENKLIKKIKFSIDT